MADQRLAALAELERRGKLKPQQLAALRELQRRKAAPKTGLADSFVNTAAGLVQGAAGLVDLPVKAVGASMGAVERGTGALSDLAFGWMLSDRHRKANKAASDARAANFENPATIGDAVEKLAPTPDDKFARAARIAAQVLGGTGSGVGLGKVLAYRPGTTALTPKPTVARVGEELAAAPVTQAAAGLAAAGGVEGARSAGAPIPVQIGAGMVAGGLAPSAARTAGSAASAPIRALTAANAREAAARVLKRSAGLEKADDIHASMLADRMEAGARPQASGALPTAAEASLDEGVAALQRALANVSTRSGAMINRRVTDNARTRLGAVDEAFGQGDAGALRSFADERSAEMGRDLDARIARVGDAVAPDAAGEQARAALSKAYSEARSRTDAAYQHPDLHEHVPVQLLPPDPADVLPTYQSAGISTEAMGGFKEQAVKAAKGAVPRPPESLIEFVRRQGGILSRVADPNPTMKGRRDMRAPGLDDLASQEVDWRSHPGLFTRNGKSPEEMFVMARNEGFFDDPDAAFGQAGTDAVEQGDFRQLLEAISDEARGSPRYRASDTAALLNHEAALDNRDFWRQTFDDRGLDPLTMKDQQWTDLYNDLNGAVVEQGRGLADLEAIPQPGVLMGTFQKLIGSMRDRYYGDGAAEAPAYVREFLREVTTTPQTTLKAMERWERRALDMARNAPDRTQASFLQSIGKAIGARAKMDTPEYRARAADAARTARREQGEKFEVGPLGSALAREDYGRYSLPDSRVGERLIARGRGGGEAADQLVNAVGDQSAEGIARVELRRALDAAAGNPSAVSRVRRDYGEALSRFPALARDVDEARDMAALAQSFPRTALGRIQSGGSDPASEVAALLRAKDNGQGFRALVTQAAPSEAATAGIRRSLASYIADRAETKARDADLNRVMATGEMLEAVETVLARAGGTRVLTDAQSRLLRTYAKELKADQFARTANRTTGSDTLRNTDVSLGIVRATALIPGSGKLKSTLEAVFQLLGRATETRDLLVDAMLDPKLAAELLRAPTPDRVKGLVERVRAYNRGALTGSVVTAD